MNIFFVIDNEIITPALSGSILSGITRDTVKLLAKKWDNPVIERRLSIDELIEAHATGKLQEMFGSGTAAVISPVGEFMYKDKVMKVGDGTVGKWSQKFFNAITDIQYGISEDTDGWNVPLE
jgi:branched-chain amino acid aminotransferase